jgi:predicted RNase H-like nuclease
VTAATAVAGVDGYRGGWIVAVLSGTAIRWHVVPSAAEVLAATASCAAVAVDIPMGLVDRGPRACDLAARHRLGPARASVFHAPVRPMLLSSTHAEAVTLGRSLDGRGISLQAWHITAKIAEWDGVIDEALQDRIVEAHPELSFLAMNGGRLGRKKSVPGAAERIVALRSHVDAAAALCSLPMGPALDDALDALALTWTARRWAGDRAEVLPPAEVPRDGRGLRMRIVV